LINKKVLAIDELFE